MAGFHIDPSDEQNDNLPSKSKELHTPQSELPQYSESRFVLCSRHLMNRVINIIYTVVGVCFLLAAILSLIYTFWAFEVSVIEIRKLPLYQQPVLEAQAIIAVISGLLLVLIIMEMLGTVIHYLHVHTTSVRPFLFIGIISATRSILSTGARLSVAGLSAEKFMNGMLELGVSAAVILALGITLKLLNGLFEDQSAQANL
jgi:uncharacterized membrane protein (DUF373 family)